MPSRPPLTVTPRQRARRQEPYPRYAPPAPLTETVHWMLQGVCRTHDDPDLWHPAKRGPNNSAEARRICVLECPVVVQCRAYALVNKERYGVWGGLDEQMREEVWRRRGIVPPPRS